MSTEQNKEIVSRWFDEGWDKGKRSEDRSVAIEGRSSGAHNK